MIVLGIDPGSEESGWVLYDAERRWVTDAGITENRQLRDLIAGGAFGSGGPAPHWLAIESMRSYTLKTNKGSAFFPQQLIDTCVWQGRFMEAWPGRWAQVPRRDVKLYLLGRANGTDADVRAALLDQVGPKGTKRDPGPTYGVSKHAWAALGVALTWYEREWGGA